MAVQDRALRSGKGSPSRERTGRGLSMLASLRSPRLPCPEKRLCPELRDRGLRFGGAGADGGPLYACHAHDRHRAGSRFSAGARAIPVTFGLCRSGAVYCRWCQKCRAWRDMRPAPASGIMAWGSVISSRRPTRRQTPVERKGTARKARSLRLCVRAGTCPVGLPACAGTCLILLGPGWVQKIVPSPLTAGRSMRMIG